MLGVVPGDITLAPGGMVRPGAGGMSVAPDAVEILPAHRRPRGWGNGSTGPRTDRIYFITSTAIEAGDLVVRIDAETHGLIEPRQRVSLRSYEAALERTRSEWVTAWPA